VEFPLKILIVGAGIGGLAVARALEMRGFTPEIAERQGNSPVEGHSIFLLGNATRALQGLGLQSEISKQAFPVRRQTILSSRGSILNRVETDEVWGACGPCMTVKRQVLVDMLRFSLVTTKISYNTTITRTASRSGKRQVFFSDGRATEYDLVIGADGIRSPLRMSQFLATAPVALGLGAWRLVLENNNRVSDWTAMLGNKLTLLGIPLPESKLYVYADCPSSSFGDGSISTLKNLFSKFGDPLGSVVAGLTDGTIVHRSLIEEVPLGNYTGEHLVLIGDAAHASSPSMAQGAAMAIEDAVVLADCVAQYSSINEAAAQFYARRNRRVEWVRAQSHARDQLRAAPNVVRNLVLRSLGTKLYQRSYRPLCEPM
jgi:2-polyprenyl-6-methoxyphenol hydroxylase-like FAD-dependent oxidoreductase